MNSTTIFLSGLGITTASSLIVVTYLRKHLQHILTELCGTEKRAQFWLTFSTICLTLTPFIFAMTYQPKIEENTTFFFELVNQLRCGLSGIMGSLIVMGVMVTVFIIIRPLTQEKSSPPPAKN